MSEQSTQRRALVVCCVAGPALLLIVCVAYRWMQDGEEVDAAVWASEDASPARYYAAAFSLLTDLDRAGEPLTAGNVRSVLGRPSAVMTSGYAFDQDGNVEWDVPRLELHYESRCVRIRVCAGGTVDVVFRAAEEGREVGKSLLAWPRELPESEMPVVRGAVRSDTEVSRVASKVGSVAAEKDDESEWFKVIQGFPERSGWHVPDDYQGACSARVAAMDFILPTLARAVLKVEGRHILYCDMWWARDEEGVWRPVSEKTANRMIRDSLQDRGSARG